MEGLIKGLLDVALGNDHNNQDDDDRQSRDERSRSSWAEVVSGDQDASDHRNPHSQNQRKEEEWQSEQGSTISNRPHNYK
ncbi:hypothetical protein L195_g050657, partial [Trifolium pratense]